jgi:hypothetical protein
MDESAVALAMLLGLPLGDVLYLSTKMNGGFDDGGHKDVCTYIVPSFVSPGMKQYFESDDFQDIVHWDHALHQAANRSLDLTIDNTLGRDQFESNLAKYRQAQDLATKRCASKTVFPCSISGGGKKKPDDETDCIMGDAGCGYQCLDEVASDLGLWGPEGSQPPC